jgi:hypothetical protein
MSLPLFQLHDIIEVSPVKALVSLPKSDKLRFMDKILDAKRADKRGLIVDFNLSSSGRRINNRIYTPAGQRAGLDSWIKPFPKPIIRNHDRNEDPMGRFVDVSYNEIDNQALSFFKNAKDFMALKDALESDDPRKIIRAFKQTKLLTNKKWPGVGELLAKARISDESAIEKFLDGRYMTFSAGSNTDRYVCSKCLCDWAGGEHCDHRPGEVTSDGDLVFFVTGTFYGEEGSVLTTPANDYSSVRSLNFADSLNYNTIPQSDCLTDISTIYITDGAIDFSDKEDTNDHLENKMDLANIDALVDALLPKLLEKLQEAATSGQEVKTADEAETTNVVTDAAPALSVDWTLLDNAVAELKASLTDVKVEVIKEVIVKDEGESELLSEVEVKLTAALAAKDSAEASLLQLQDSVKDHAAALALIDELKAEVSELTEKLDTATTSLQNRDEADKLPLDKERGSVQNPSESGTPSLQDSGSTKRNKNLDGFEQKVVEKFKQIRDSNGDPAAQMYVKNLQVRGILSRKFNIDSYIKEIN